MAAPRRGSKEWTPGMVPGEVKGLYYRTKKQAFRLRPLGNVTSLADLPVEITHSESMAASDFMINAETAIGRKDPLELYEIQEWKLGRPQMKFGHLLWFPSFKRAGIVFWPKAQEAAEWTDAANPLDALELWVHNEMTE